MYQPTLGRFLSRDPLNENGVDVLTDTGIYADRLAAMSASPWLYGGNWAHPYVYADNSPMRYIDPSGNMTVIPLHNELNPPCGGNSRIYWDFRLTEKKHCAGYFIQQVDVRCEAIACTPNCKCPTSTPKTITFTYWEAFYVRKDQPLYYLRQSGVRNYTDVSDWPAVENTCGNVSAFGTIKFYCLSDTGYLGLDNLPDPASGWKTNQQYQGGRCAASARNLPSTDDKALVDKFWNKKPLESATRSSALSWNCCDKNGKPYGSANPQ